MINLATIACILLVPAVIIQIVFLFRKKSDPDPVSHWLILAAAVLLLATMVWRSIQISFVALTGTFESLIFYSAVVCILVFIYRLQKKIPYIKGIAFGATFIALVLLAVASSPLASKDVLAPIPALRSSWLLLHVSFSFIGESFFVISFASALATLITKNPEKQKNYDRITYTCIAVGYPIFTAGALIFGAVWAQKAWGRWWGWDPKETWALITWLVYTFYLHLRLISKKSGKMPALVAVIGFLCTVFTFFGVNYLLPGLHSYK
ncbi:cytochrome c biogenesis protein CcsA [Breznakiella homolactica]|uniref:Cytochrome c biogenesis protein CcsA n=1 Tax=Breznakiella homolactica TaxID=2798577 RepID=A0A7T7XP98_9SPIR|nr:cytochrome c biogenesis protein CcsA [Breznakiella homolactica]QQO09999.1 cytochrome c biogenesis protein CcsA [Breznakiella homolactica]